MPIDIGQVVKAWKQVPEAQSLVGKPASSLEIAAAEQRLGRTLPADLRELYEHLDGGWMVRGNIVIKSVFEIGQPLPSIRESYASWTAEGKPIPPAFDGQDLDAVPISPFPDEMIDIGSDGSDSEFFIWASRDVPTKPLVIESGDFSLDCLGIVGDALAPFLAARTAFYLLSDLEYGDAVEIARWNRALDSLGVPASLRASFEDHEEDLGVLHNWASPNLPVKSPDAYRKPWTVEQIADFARS